MYTKSARFYDAIYSFKNYEMETAILHTLIQQRKKSDGATLLDVACGTGRHLSYLRKHYAIEGLDLNPEFLAIARQRCPDVLFHQGDMTVFDLDRTFDAITCLFSAIGYAGTVEKLDRAVATMARHLKPGGVMIVEPWLKPEQYMPGHLAARFVDEPDLKIARLSISELRDRVSVMDMHHLVATPEGIEYFVERHELTLFDHEEYMAAFRAAGLDVTYDPDGLTGRGLYIGVRPVQEAQ